MLFSHLEEITITNLILFSLPQGQQKNRTKHVITISTKAVDPTATIIHIPLLSSSATPPAVENSVMNMECNCVWCISGSGGGAATLSTHFLFMHFSVKISTFVLAPAPSGKSGIRHYLTSTGLVQIG